MDSSNKQTTKKKNPRCACCKKKVGLLGFTCECGGLFCAKHHLAFNHECPKLEEKKEKTKDTLEKKLKEASVNINTEHRFEKIN